MTTQLIASGLFVLLGYLLGSIPTGFLMGKLLKGIDIREYGSGSTGATNVLRTVGKGAAIAVLVIDLLKGAAAPGMVKGFYAIAPAGILPDTWQPWLVTLTALVAIIGHSKSVWLKFSGGKSAASGLGVLLVMNPLIALGTLGIFALVLAISRIVSLGSICSAIAANGLMLFLHQPPPYCVFAALAGLYVVLRHRSNIQRILAGVEPTIGQKLQEKPE
ncbi:glycerol-3-phosphate 1-O-acyltransferase PlsY [Lusitaniella coriacea LEGE 07157]|uniref:Glycerol-3-phosphate acyltransferase n=1 Tax=Lusitaniella coriacea LEGE 07157 TaxID=945747 RepID=A0A8J7DXU9_9CYAN|nr:glycerol-3-phosphate 1-O-acyltransferase PlsY [Lusitaniella coriacea]MBE9117331.1 glycerol-3-phosphate 1-O-acyltransferase PlsY [Lusitaniella coriacea LEGE 07157]